MAAVDEDALICDFAEIYHVLDYKRLPLRTAAVFAQGLPENSRIMRRLSGMRIGLETALLAELCDRVGILIWQHTENGRNPPASIKALLLGDRPDKPEGFTTAADFDAAWSAIAGDNDYGN